jgi:outer membrane immunogenic protein
MRRRYSVLLRLCAGAFFLGLLDAHAGGLLYGPVREETWNGGYAGLNGGYGWGPNGSSGTTFASTTSGKTAAGYVAGAEAGYNWQGRFGLEDYVLVGVEADIQGSTIEASNDQIVFAVVQTGNSFRSSLDWFGTLRGRIGFAFSPVLFYGTAGLAAGSVRNSIDGVSNGDGISIGYALGGGVEYRFSQEWSFKVEYLYINLGDNAPSNADEFRRTAGRDNEYDIVRFGLNYRFSPCCAAPLK